MYCTSKKNSGDENLNLIFSTFSKIDSRFNFRSLSRQFAAYVGAQNENSGDGTNFPWH